MPADGGVIMVSKKEVRAQLKKIGFKQNGWGRTEISELPRILIPGEEVYECANGIYEGGFALLVATDVRVLLIDKKPLNYLTVEDMRFDMISEMDYSHRLLGANINISSGGKSLSFRSYNQKRLRKLIGHVQHCMAEIKQQQTSHQDSQVSHLEQINQQLQAYLVATHQYQMQMQSMTNQSEGESATDQKVPSPPKPSNELADYLYAQRLLDQYKQDDGERLVVDPRALPKISVLPTEPTSNQIVDTPLLPISEPTFKKDKELEDIFADGVREVFGTQDVNTQAQEQVENIPQQTNNSNPQQSDYLSVPVLVPDANHQKINIHKPIYINPLQIAFSKLPMALRLRKFGRPALKAHTSTNAPNPTPTPTRA